MAEYKLSYTAEEVDNLLNKIATGGGKGSKCNNLNGFRF